MNFDQAFRELLHHEGSYSDHAADPGGKTMYGITELVAREVGYRGNMNELPLDLAKRIYLERYWKPISADDLPPAIRYAVFDAAVNSGTGQSIIWLQRALGVQSDGIIGPVTIRAAYAADPQALKSKILATRLKFMSNLSTWPSFGRGWARRIAHLMEMA
jgi:lysozyme family protein